MLAWQAERRCLTCSYLCGGSEAAGDTAIRRDALRLYKIGHFIPAGTPDALTHPTRTGMAQPRGRHGVRRSAGRRTRRRLNGERHRLVTRDKTDLETSVCHLPISLLNDVD